MSKNTIETKGKIYMGDRKNLIIPSNPLEEQAAKIREEKEAEEIAKKFKELAAQKQAELDAKMEKLELIPMKDKVVLMPYPENPYKKIATEGGIIVEYDGSFMNPDSGEKDKQSLFVGCAKVIEIGPETKYVKPGDDVFYDTRTVYPVPFLSMGYRLTSENQLLIVLNEGLKERFKME